MFLLRTHRHTPKLFLHLPPPPPSAGVQVWVSVIASGLVPRRLHTSIHTNHSMSALWMDTFWLCPCKVRPPLKRAVSASCLFLYFPLFFLYSHWLMHDGSHTAVVVCLHIFTDTHRKMARLNVVLMGSTSQEKGINTSTTTQPHRQSTHIITARTWGLISHTQLVHLVNVKRAVIVNYIPI